MSAHVGSLDAAALIGVGAAFDIHAGNLPQAPRWMQRSGLEWLFRLAAEPRRLWRRYVINIPRFLFKISRRRPKLMAAAEPRDGSGNVSGAPQTPSPRAAAS